MLGSRVCLRAEESLLPSTGGIIPYEANAATSRANCTASNVLSSPVRAGGWGVCEHGMAVLAAVLLVLLLCAAGGCEHGMLLLLLCCCADAVVEAH